MDDSRILPFTSRTGHGSGGGKEPPDDAESVAAGDAYATARGSRATTLRFLRHDGKAFAMPYAFHPIVWGESPSLVLLEYPGFFTVVLGGRNLGLLETYLCDQRVTWIRECGDADADRLPVAVTRIARMNCYPSREPEGNGQAG